MLIAAPARGQAEAQTPLAGKWLLDRGRTLGLLTPRPTVEDAERALIWMEAAARVSPDLAEAYLWQYDLLNRLSRTDAAMAALGSYCKLNPADISAQLDLIDWKFERGQSVEARLAFCTEMLRTADLSPVVQSDLHRRMAGLYVRSGDRSQAQACATKALEAFAGNVAAHALLVELVDEHERAAGQVRMSLAAIAASPANAGEMWRLARLLDSLSLHAEAAKWYERVLTLFELHPGDVPVPVNLLVDFAACCADDGKHEQALEVGARALDINPDSLEARLLLVEVARKSGHAEATNEHREVLRDRFDALDPTSFGNDRLILAGQAAWYYLCCEPDPQRAVLLASRARELMPDSPEVQVVYGLAKLAAEEPDEAATVLRPWTEANQWAAAGLGEALRAQGHTEEALAVWRAGEALRYSGQAYERIVAALASQQQEPSPIPSRAAVIEALRSFDDRMLAFPARPTEALRLEVLAHGKQWAYGEPWLCELRLTNTAAYALSIGAEQMVAGRVLVSLKWGERIEQQFVNYLPLSLALQPVLAPGESITVTQTLDTGPAFALARSTPQRELSLSLSFLLDPVVGRTGEWGSALRGFPPVVVRMQRVAADGSRTGIPSLVRLLREGSEAERIKAVRTLGALIAEREAMRKAPPGYFLHRVDDLRLRKLILWALADPAPVVRAAALDSLRVLELGSRMLAEIAPLLSDANWLVRLEALDMLAETQGESLRPVLERTSASDPDELVRRLADWRLKQLPTVSTQGNRI